MSTPVHTVVLFSDVHFDEHHKALWENFVRVVADIEPTQLVGLGDMGDLGLISKYAPEKKISTPIEQARVLGREISRVSKYAKRTDLLMGNHDERWERFLYKDKAYAFDGAKGLTWQDQTYAQGLDPSVRWHHESANNPGLMLGNRALLCQHGHISSRGGKYLASRYLDAIPGISVARGHHHTAQLSCHTSLGTDRFGIAMPHMSGYHEYAGGNPNWQIGFAVVEFHGKQRLRDCVKLNPYIVVANQKGQFSFRGKVYA